MNCSESPGLSSRSGRRGEQLVGIHPRIGADSVPKYVKHQLEIFNETIGYDKKPQEGVPSAPINRSRWKSSSATVDWRHLRSTWNYWWDYTRWDLPRQLKSTEVRVVLRNSTTTCSPNSVTMDALPPQYIRCDTAFLGKACLSAAKRQCIPWAIRPL